MNTLISLIQKHVIKEQTTNTAIPGLTLSHRSTPTGPLYGVQTLSVCIVAQGSKTIYFGDEILKYEPGDLLISTLELPITGYIDNATEKAPFLLVKLDFSPQEILSIMKDLNATVITKEKRKKSVAIDPLTPNLLNAITRLVGLLDTPDDISYLSPLILKEILYHLLKNPNGHLLKQIVSNGSSINKINLAIDFITKHFTESFQMEKLYQLTHMSSTTFNRHFKEATGMSPIQFQKRLKLQEARQRLLLGVDSVTEIALQVGYESLSHFNREYVRMFGASPKKDIRQLMNVNAINRSNLELNIL